MSKFIEAAIRILLNILLFAAFIFGHYKMSNMETFVAIIWWFIVVANLLTVCSKKVIKTRLEKKAGYWVNFVVFNGAAIFLLLIFGYIWLPAVSFICSIFIVSSVFGEKSKSTN